MIFLLLVSFHWVLSVAVNEVTQFGFRTHTIGASKSNDDFRVTLWFNHTVYQYQFSPNKTNAWFHAYVNSYPTFTILGSSHCSPESKIMFEKWSGGDSLKVNTIQFDTDSGDFYGITKYINDDGSTEQYICIDRTGEGCAPPKQIFYFDISRPNTYIEDAVYMDGTSVAPQPETCEPTAIPSRVTAYPSIAPSDVTAHPTGNPTRDAFKREEFSIKIKFNGCTNDGSEACAFNVTADEINTILIAYLDVTVRLIGTVIEGNTVTAVLSIDAYGELDGDQITDGIEKELEREYGRDVEVTIRKNEDIEADKDEDEEPNSWNRLIEWTELWNLGFVIGAATAILMCLFITLCFCCYCKRKKKALEGKRAEQMVATEITTTTGTGGDHATAGTNDTETVCKHDDTVTVCKDKDEQEESYDAEELYQTESVVTTTGGGTTQGEAV